MDLNWTSYQRFARVSPLSRGGVFPSGAGRGQKSAGRGGAKVKIRGAGRGKRTRKSTDPKIRQKCVYCYGDIYSVLWCFDKWKHYLLSLLKGISVKQTVKICKQRKIKRFSYSFFLTLIAGIMLFVGRGGAACFSAGRGVHPCHKLIIFKYIYT